MKLSAQESQHRLNNQKSAPQHFNPAPRAEEQSHVLAFCGYLTMDVFCNVPGKSPNLGSFGLGWEADSGIFPTPHKRYPVSTL